MKKIIALAASLVAVTSVPALAQTIEWRGVAIILSTTTACANDYAVGNSIPMRYRPSGIGSNGSNSKFAFHQTFYAQSFVTSSGRFATSTAAVVNAGSLGAGWGGFTNTAKMRLTVTPSNHSATTASLAFAGQIQNFGDISGCTISFRSSAALKK